MTHRCWRRRWMVVRSPPVPIPASARVTRARPTPRPDRRLLVMLAEGHSLKDVATRLKLSVKTVDAHKCRLMGKLDLHDRTELIRYAIRKKLIET